MEIIVNNVSVCTIHLDKLNTLTKVVLDEIIETSIEDFLVTDKDELIIKLNNHE